MGRITTSQNQIGHLQSVLANKNEAIRSLTSQVRELTAARDKAADELARQERRPSLERSTVCGSFQNRFDPFTDANDDYAVLEWMRVEAQRDGISLLKDVGLLRIGAWQYQIGDYARAALKVLENE